MKTCGSLLLIGLFLIIGDNCFGESTKQEAGATFFVSTNGSDLFSGRYPEANRDKTDGPFATIEKARDAIRSLKTAGRLPAGGISVYIRGGIYPTGKMIEFINQDSGSEQMPIVYRAYQNEKVRLVGGKEITGFKPIDDPTILARIEAPYRDKIVQVNLKSFGITDFGKMMPRGFGRPIYPSGLELFFMDKPMQLARWPNRGWALISGVPAGPRGGKFNYIEDRPMRWINDEDIWLHGFWTYDWADSYEKVKSIDPDKKEIVTYEPHGVYGYSPGKRYYALNILEELDEPGEWYLDRKTGILYFWPPSPLSQGKTFVSLIDSIIQMQNVSYITIQGFEIGICRGTAIKIVGGTHNRVAGCTLRNIGNVAVTLDGGSENGVIGCDIYGCGDGGIRLGGGNRQTLTPGNNYAHNNHIHNYSRWVRTYRPAIWISGVGNTISNNLIHDAPHSAIILEGNEHLIQFNEIHHVCMETSDAGAFYMGRDYSQWGNIIRYNFFHELGSGEVQAIYLDDFTSGTKVFGNVIYKTTRGVVINGGRDNIVEKNIFVDCRVAVYLMGAVRKYFEGLETILLDRLNAVKYKEPPYSTRYPELAKILEENPGAPKGNSVTDNIIYGGGAKWLNLIGVGEEMVTLRNNLIGKDPGFVDPLKMNFQLKDDSPAYKLGFQRIPMEKIGLYNDSLRASWPVPK